MTEINNSEKDNLQVDYHYIENISLKNIERDLRKIAEKRFSSKESKLSNELHFLKRIGFLDQNFDFTEIGLDYYKKKYIQNEKKKADEIFSMRLKDFRPVRILCELLWGRKDLTKDNIYQALLVYDLINRETTIDEITGFIMILNRFGILTYSKKTNNIVIKYNPGMENPEREEKIISPSTPFTNIKNLREIFRNCEDYVIWIDKHFGKRGFELLIEELDGNEVSDVKILMSINSSDDFVKLHKDFKRFKTEMEHKGINSTCKVIVDKDLINDIHGRWIISKSFCYKVPPLNSIFKGQYDELVKIESRPEYDEWWSKSYDLLSDWNEIQKHNPKNQ